MNAKVPFWYGVALTILGGWSYLATGATSITALIPALFGIVLQLLAFAVGQERLRLPALYAVLLVALLGVAGSAVGVPDFVRAVFGGVVQRPVAVGVQAAMAFFCFGLTLVAAKAVLGERRAQRKQTPRRSL